MTDEAYKQCSLCGRQLPATPEFFYRSWQSKPDKERYRSWCKECFREQERGMHARIRRTLRAAVRRGTVHRPGACQDCGKACTPQGHHEDYSKPFEAVWLCTSCHGKRHSTYPFATATLHVQIDDAYKARLDAQATAEQRTIKAVVVRALEAYLEAHGEERAA